LTLCQIRFEPGTPDIRRIIDLAVDDGFAPNLGHSPGRQLTPKAAVCSGSVGGPEMVVDGWSAFGPRLR
jgi:hypothetical protein